MIEPNLLQTYGPPVALAFIAVGVVVLAVFARRSVQRLTPMLSVETIPIEDVKPGMVEFEGTVVDAGETITGKGTASEEAVISEFRADRGDSEYDFTLPVPQQLAPNVLNETTAVPFYVEDDTGRILVDPTYASISLAADHHEHQQLSEYKEVAGYLQPSDDVYVLGEAIPAAEYAERATGRGGFVRSFVRQLRGPNPQVESFLDDEEFVVTRTADTSTFVISDSPEWRSWLRQGLMAAFWTLSGLFVIVGGIYLLIPGF